MSEMVDRVARAIGEKIAPALQPGGEPVRVKDVASAVIEAMRDASFGMVGAGQIAVNLADDDESPMYLGQDEVEEIWEAMIDAALKD